MQNSFKNSYFKSFLVFFGEPISQHLLRYRALAVKYHSFIPCASHLQQPRLVNNPGEIFITTGINVQIIFQLF